MHVSVSFGSAFIFTVQIDWGFVSIITDRDIFNIKNKHLQFCLMPLPGRQCFCLITDKKWSVHLKHAQVAQKEKHLTSRKLWFCPIEHNWNCCRQEVSEGSWSVSPPRANRGEWNEDCSRYGEGPWPVASWYEWFHCSYITSPVTYCVRSLEAPAGAALVGPSSGNWSPAPSAAAPAAPGAAAGPCSAAAAGARGPEPPDGRRSLLPSDPSAAAPAAGTQRAGC